MCSSPGHAGRLHRRVSDAGPTQSSPPLRGDGSSHFLSRDWVPLPHVTLHADHAFHSLQPPSTGNNIIIIVTSPRGPTWVKAGLPGRCDHSCINKGLCYRCSGLYWRPVNTSINRPLIKCRHWDMHCAMFVWIFDCSALTGAYSNYSRMHRLFRQEQNGHRKNRCEHGKTTASTMMASSSTFRQRPMSALFGIVSLTIIFNVF